MNKKRRKEKLRIQKIYPFIIIIFVVILSFFILQKKVIQKSIENDTCAPQLPIILGNLSEYNNQLYISTLTQEQKNSVSMNLEQIFNQKCEVLKRCSVPFLSMYIDIKSNLGIPVNEILKDKEATVMSTYSQIPYNLTENELKGFEIPLLIGLCKVGFLNQTEKIAWAERIINLKKSDTSLSSYKQILYFIECLNVDTVDTPNKMTGISVDEMKNKLCNNVLSNVNIVDVCTFFTDLRMKKFCWIKITSDEENAADIFLSEKYGQYYLKNCQDKLSKNYNQFFNI